MELQIVNHRASHADTFGFFDWMIEHRSITGRGLSWDYRDGGYTMYVLRPSEHDDDRVVLAEFRPNADMDVQGRPTFTIRAVPSLWGLWELWVADPCFNNA